MGLASLVLLHVLIRVDPGVSLTPATVADIASEARRVWTAYGVDLCFALPGCAGSARESDELLLVITNRFPPEARPQHADVAGIGWIEFAGPGQPAHTLTVSIAAASKLSDRATWAGRSVDLLPAIVRERFLVHALGRAVAHEVGHFLLRSTAHARAGLMRAQFPLEDLMDDRLTRFQLEPGQVEVVNRLPRGAPVELQAFLQ